MKCEKCKQEFEERHIQESHDVPCYLFEGNRKGRKNQADKYGRHLLCEKCHKKYDDSLKILFIQCALKFSKMFFKKEAIKSDSKKSS